MKILIIGANGFTGRRILNDLRQKKEHQLFGCSLSDDISPSAGYQFIKTDITHREAMQQVFQMVSPDVVINTSALSVPDYCESHHEEAYEVNAAAVGYVGQLCNVYNSRFIHLSTDFVFDGKNDRLYTETDQPNPVNYYGVTKWEGEKLIEKTCNNYAIIRVVVVYGKGLPGQHGNILQLVANKLRHSEPIRVVCDQWLPPTYVGDISEAVHALIYPQAY